MIGRALDAAGDDDAELAARVRAACARRGGEARENSRSPHRRSEPAAILVEIDKELAAVGDDDAALAASVRAITERIRRAAEM